MEMNDALPATRPVHDSVWNILRRRHRLALIFGGIAATCCMVGFSMVRPMYQANATLVVDRDHTTRLMSDDGAEHQIDYSFLNTQRDLLLSDDVLSRAIIDAKSGNRPPYLHSPDSNAMLRRRMTVIVSRDSWVIAVSLRDENQLFAHDLLAAVLNSFKRHEIELHQEQSRGELEFLNRQVGTERALLTEARSHEQDFRASHGILSADPDRSPIAVKLGSYSEKNVELVRELNADRAVVDQLGATDAILDPAKRTRALLEIKEIMQDPAVGQHREALSILQDKAVQLSQKYKMKHPRMLEITEQIRAESAQLDQAIGIARHAMENHARAISKEDADMSEQTRQLRNDMTHYRGDLMQMEALSEERSTREKLFSGLLARLRQEEISSQLGAARLLVVDAPHGDSQPVNIHWPLFLLSSAIAAGAGAIIAVFLAEALDHRVADADKARELTNLDILGFIPHVDGILPLGRALDQAKTSSQSHELRLLDEGFQALRVNLRLGEEIDNARVLMVASCSPREGRSMITARLGRSLAASGLRVLVVDCDLRRPTLDRQVGEICLIGLNDWLEGDSRVRPVATSHKGLDLIGSGKAGEPGRLQGRRLRILIDAFRPHYDCILLDTSPLNMSADALVAATVVDHILLTVRGRHTTRDSLSFALHRLGWLRQQVLGIIFNDDHRDMSGLNPMDASMNTFQRRPSLPVSHQPPMPNGIAASDGQPLGI
jgi:succinoglycan biosynthesis transport protein ExoP